MKWYTESSPLTSVGPPAQPGIPGGFLSLLQRLVAPAFTTWTPWLAVGMLAAVAVPGPAHAEYDRPVKVSPVVGARTFSKELQLNSEFAFGIRVALGLSEHVSVAIDAGHSSPVRRTTGKSMSFGEIRLLTLVRALRGPVSPYAVLGVGGQVFNFADAPGTTSGILASGLGIEATPFQRWSFFAEGSADIYRASFKQDFFPRPSSRETLGTGVLSAGASYSF